MKPSRFPALVALLAGFLALGLAPQQTQKPPSKNPAKPEAEQAKSAKVTLRAAQVPVAVREAFQTRFPNIKDATWVVKSDKNYEAYEIHFENANEVLKAQFHADGTVLTQSAKPKVSKK